MTGSGPVVDAVHAGPAGLLQALGGGDVGGDHELLDQAMRIEALLALDRDRAAGVVEPDRGLGQIEVEGAAAAAGVEQGREGAEQRPDDALEQGRGQAVGRAVGRRLDLLRR